LDFVSWIVDENKGQQTLSEVQYPLIYHDGDDQPMAIYAERLINNTIS
jgi:hypothetical protein